MVASLQCLGPEAEGLYPDLSAFAWTGLVSEGGDSTCGQGCTWTDVSSGRTVANVSAIKPCAMVGDGSAAAFVKWGAQGCAGGGTNDEPPETTAHYVCRTSCCCESHACSTSPCLPRWNHVSAQI
jgi:hypothetical protein